MLVVEYFLYNFYCYLITIKQQEQFSKVLLTELFLLYIISLIYF